MQFNFLFASITLIMAIFSIYLIYLIKKGIKGLGFLIVLYLAGSMVVMFLTLPLFFSTQDKTIQALTFLINSFYMIFGLIAIIALSKKNLENTKNSYTLFLFAVMMTLSEALMGQTFYSIITGNFGNPLIGVENYYYFSTMAAEMIATIVLFYKQLTYPLKQFLIITLPIMVISPVIFPDNLTFVYDTIWISAVLMIIATVIIYETLYRSRLKQTQETMTSLELMLIYTLMMAGEFAFFLTESWYLFDFSMIAGMSWFIYRGIVGPSKIKGNYLRDVKWTFTFISLTFVMEWFMGGVLEFASGDIPAGISGFMSSLALGYIPPSSYFGLGAIFDFISIVSTITGSMWFMIMMGMEMGMLAALRILELKKTENRIRMGLMITAFAIYTIYLPSFSPIASNIDHIPYMWSMGLGTLGPVSPSVLLTGIIGTYIVSGILSFMFGSRQICSVTCTAPLMYQGTFYDSLKVFNRTSKLGRKTLGSKLRPWYKGVAIFVWSSLLAMAVISYLDQINVIDLTIIGNDLTTFLYSFYFNFLWYLVFISIPFMGTYACATQGWCSWGTFNQFFGRLGFFRLKVKDPAQCVKCETKACANACPVGLTDLPGSFIKKGEFKALKCLGVGDCVEACPYDNIYFHDVRHVMKRLLKW